MVMVEGPWKRLGGASVPYRNPSLVIKLSTVTLERSLLNSDIVATLTNCIMYGRRSHISDKPDKLVGSESTLNH
jgi:hypothetical protein